VLLSDHGMASRQGPLPGNHNTPDAFSGIFAIYGPGVVRRGATLPELSVLDVAPTLAYLLGIPIADDLPGRFVAEAIDPSALLVAPPKRIDSWDRFLPFP
jgi:arylsulfatase A-like enzyme